MVMEEMKKRLREEMNASFYRCEGDATTYASAIAEAEKLIKSKYPTKKQTCYSQIPVFPRPYTKGNVPIWACDDSSLTNDYLPSNPRSLELNNLLMQLAHHSLEVASLIIPTDETPQRPLKKLAVTPISPEMVLRPESEPPSPQGIELDDPQECSKMAAKKAAKPKVSKAEKEATRLRTFAPPDAKIRSKVLPKEEKEEPQKARPGQDTYHIIRIYQHSGRRYLELLRQDSDGYIIAWRILNLDEFFTAYWCFFSDFAYLKKDLPFLKIRVMKYGSGYGTLTHIYYAPGTLDAIIDEFLHKLYSNPERFPTDTGRTYFYILCLLFGEAPRLEAIRNYVDSKMPLSHYECAYSKQHKLGVVLNGVIHTWSNTCDTLFYLILVQLEKAIREDIIETRLSSIGSFRQLFEQFDFNQSKAHLRCEESMRVFSSLFLLMKDEDSTGKNHLYDEIALHQLINELHLLKHNPELVTSIILRRGNFRKQILVPGLKVEPRTTENEPIDSPSVMFWKHYKRFLLLEKRSPLDVMNFLEDARQFLIDYKFDQYNLELYDDLVAKCNVFIDLRLSGRASAVGAAEAAYSSGLNWNETEAGPIYVIIEFLESRRPSTMLAEG